MPFRSFRVRASIRSFISNTKRYCRLAVLGVFAFLVAGSIWAQSSQTRLGPDQDGWTFSNQDATIIRYYGSSSAAACRADCEKNPQCTAY